jgi:hypothetical protein
MSDCPRILDTGKRAVSLAQHICPQDSVLRVAEEFTTSVSTAQAATPSDGVASCPGPKTGFEPFRQ